VLLLLLLLQLVVMVLVVMIMMMISGNSYVERSKKMHHVDAFPAQHVQKREDTLLHVQRFTEDEY